MLYTIEELLQEIYKEVYRVYDVFKDFFGEEYVDLQYTYSTESISDFAKRTELPQIEDKYEISDELLQQIKRGATEPIILVWWPSVKVTNEHSKSVIIKDLFAKIPITLEGQIPYEKEGFTLNRSTYTAEQYTSDYMHSHIPGIPKSNHSEFLRPCLGTGPIRRTIDTLKVENDDASWMLFCQELSLYVTVESLSGIPYRHLESIGACSHSVELNYSSCMSAINFQFIPNSEEENKRYFKEFTKFYLQNNHLKIGFRNGAYVLDMPMYDYALDVSNAFIKCFNTYWANTVPISRLFSNRVLVKAISCNNKWYREGSSQVPAEFVQGQLVCYFKGEEKRLKITDIENQSSQTPAILLEPCAAMPVLNYILKLINYNNSYYEYFRKQRTSEESTSTDSKTICFL